MPSGFAALVVRVLMELNLRILNVSLLFANLPRYMRSAASVHTDETAAREMWLLCSVVFALVYVIISILGLTRFTDSINLAGHQIDIELANDMHLVNLLLNCPAASKQIFSEPRNEVLEVKVYFGVAHMRRADRAVVYLGRYMLTLEKLLRLLLKLIPLTLVKLWYY